MQAPVVITSPASEPVTLAEVKEWLRLTGSAEDSTITSLAKQARETLESRLARAFVSTGFRWTAERFPDSRPVGVPTYDSFGRPRRSAEESSLLLPRADLVSVESVKYLDGAGTLTVFDSANYRAVPGTPPRIALTAGASWPATLASPDAIRVEFTAGYSAVPDWAKTAIKVLTALWYRNRGDAEFAIPPAIEYLIGPGKWHVNV